MFVLASNSPRRKELFGLVSKDFIICPSDAQEIVPPGTAPEKVAEVLSALKAEAVCEKYPDDIVVGCDTVVICGGRIYGKPRDREDAFTTLRTLSGKMHSVITGVTLIRKCDNRRRTFSQKSLVKFYELTDDEINAYIDTGEPFDKAGSYGIQDQGALLVNGIDGDYYNIMGLPVAMLKRQIDKFLAM